MSGVGAYVEYNLVVIGVAKRDDEVVRGFVVGRHDGQSPQYGNGPPKSACGVARYRESVLAPSMTHTSCSVEEARYGQAAHALLDGLDVDRLGAFLPLARLVLGLPLPRVQERSVSAARRAGRRGRTGELITRGLRERRSPRQPKNSYPSRQKSRASTGSVTPFLYAFVTCRGRWLHGNRNCQVVQRREGLRLYRA
jgi:hypothetical protein